MSSDQAEILRRLVSRNHPDTRSSRCQWSVLSGCKGGVGTTTLSLNLAAAIQRLGSRVLLVDCSPFRGDLEHIYRLPNDHGLDDVLDARCSLQQAISTGPGGIHVLPRRGTTSALSTSTCWQVLRHLEPLGRDFDHIVVDAGNCTAAAETLWSAVDQVVVVTTTQQVAITDAYALVKCMANRKLCPPRIGFAINRYHNTQNAIDLQQRLIQSCEQFLTMRAQPFGCIPADDLWELAVNEARSIACKNPRAPGAVAIHEMAQQLTSSAESRFDLNPMVAG